MRDWKNADMGIEKRWDDEIEKCKTIKRVDAY